jgi:lipid-binding SYLF domain-containing protein
VGRVALFVAVWVAGSSRAAFAVSPALDADARAALTQLCGSQPAAKMLRQKARAVLVFPNVVKAGFMVGGAYGDGTLFDGAGRGSATTTRRPEPRGRG